MIVTIHMKVGGMKCAGCEEGLRQALESIDGVVAAIPERSARRVTVNFENSRVSPDLLKEAIRSHGYRVPRD